MRIIIAFSDKMATFNQPKKKKDNHVITSSIYSAIKKIKQKKTNEMKWTIKTEEIKLSSKSSNNNNSNNRNDFKNFRFFKFWVLNFESRLLF